MNDFVNKVIQLSKKQELIDLELKIKKEELKRLELWNKKIEIQMKHDNIKKIFTLVMFTFLAPFIILYDYNIFNFKYGNTESDTFIYFNNIVIEFIDRI